MNKKIMIVDDAMFMRKMIEKMLRTNGYDTILAGSGEECLDLYREQQPDIVLLDITMPDKNGLEILDDLIAMDRHACVVMCSALGQEEMMASALRKGAKDFIVKPFKEQQILRVIEGLSI